MAKYPRQWVTDSNGKPYNPEKEKFTTKRGEFHIIDGDKKMTGKKLDEYLSKK